MPVTTIDLNDIYNSVTRPVALNVLRHIMKMTGIPQDTPTQYLGNSGARVILGAGVESADAPTRFTQSNKMFIEVTEETIRTDEITRYTHQHENRPVFSDPKLQVSITPIYSRQQQNFTIGFRTEDEGTAVRWRNGLSRKISEMRAEMLHELEYHYLIPQPFMGLLVDVYNLREGNAGYGDTLKEYIKDHFSENATTLATADGARKRLAIQERQIQALGWFGFETPPREEKQPTGSVWTISVDYTFQYDQPISLVARYPIAIHSTPLGERWTNRNRQYVPTAPGMYRSASRSAMSAVMKGQGYAQHNAAVEGSIYPEYDDWYPDQKIRGTEWAMRMMMVPDLNDPTLLINLADLETFNIVPQVLAYMRRYPQYLGNPYESPFFFTAFKFDNKYPKEAVTVGSDFNARLVEAMDPRNLYRLCLGQVIDLSILSPEAQDRVKEDGALVDLITNKDNDKNPGGGVTDEVWDNIVKPRGRKVYGPRNVTFYSIIAHRRTEIE